MNTDNLYLADPSAEKATYIQFMMLVFEPYDVSVILKVDNELIDVGQTLTAWRWTKRVVPISINDPPLLDITEQSRQLFQENAEETFTLYQEALLQGAYEQLEPDIIRIKVYDFRKANNISNMKLRPYNRWVVFTGDNLPNFYQSILGKYYEA